MNYREERYKAWLENAQACKNDFEDFLRKGILIKIQDGDVWKKRHMEKANHNLDFAALITELHKNIIKERFPRKSFYDWVTVAYYYAIYHAALALVSASGLKSKSHLATLCGVIKCYYHEDKVLERKHVETLGKIERTNIEQFIESQDLRERASYGVSTSFEERLAIIARKDSVEFVNKVKEILK
jgi:uncharacterized protein (UPF0332 family)